MCHISFPFFLAKYRVPFLTLKNGIYRIQHVFKNMDYIKHVCSRRYFSMPQKQIKKQNWDKNLSWCGSYTRLRVELAIAWAERVYLPLLLSQIHWLALKSDVVPKILWADFILRLSDEPRPLSAKLQPKKGSKNPLISFLFILLHIPPDLSSTNSQFLLLA